jgi:hypothetical protein
MGFLFGLLEAVVLTACCLGCGWRLMHYFQLESYQLPGYARSLKRNAQRALIPCVGAAAAALVAAVLAAHGRKRKVFLIVIIFNGIAI